MKTHFRQIDIHNILFLDIETVPQYPSYMNLSPRERLLWNKKAQKFQTGNERPSELYKKAGIFAEFGKIICISVAYVLKQKNSYEVRVRSFYGDNELELLQDFMSLITKHYNTSRTYFCAHNGNEFDLPYLSRRALIHNIELPFSLDTRGKKTWEVQHIDTLDLWRFGDYKNYTSLELLTHIFSIPTPKDDIDGSMVCDIYWKERNLSRIVSYCQKDVVAVLQLFRKYRGEALFLENQITIVS